MDVGDSLDRRGRRSGIEIPEVGRREGVGIEAEAGEAGRREAEDVGALDREARAGRKTQDDRRYGPGRPCELYRI